MTQAVQTYAYLRSSAVHESTAGRSLALETSGGATPSGAVANPRFFSVGRPPTRARTARSGRCWRAPCQGC
ncbi:hypothetical protein [Kitasatospora atroaurantiaca]|uniref:hypothetical protein n=1 Tax=Kitasatospora atroaurantiaca TaxID=285545 RepID=UPI00119E994A|nr:hypothetical protein [Kitasatospora atroaurantiaca]